MLKEFIKHIHSNADGLIEFREISEVPGSDKPKVKCIFKSLNEINEYIPPQDKNVYIGMFTRSKRSGTAKDCISTNVLWADYDDMSLEQVKKVIEASKIPKPSIYINSGYGIHAYWKLKERAGVEAIKIIKEIAKVTGADSKVTDVARIMRVPGTNNMKRGACKPCRIVEANHIEYDISELEQATQGEYRAFKTHTGITTSKPCIDKMLQGVGKGHRNFALGRITKQLQLQGYTRSKALEESLKFNDRCEPSKSESEVIQDFNAYWDTDYKLLGCKIQDTKLQSILSDYCNFSECSNQKTDSFNVDLDNSISYNNRTVFKDYNSLTGNELIILGILKKYPQGLNRSRLEQSLYSPGAKKSFMTSKRLEKTLDKLKADKLIEFTDLAQVEKGKSNNYNNYFAKYIDQSNYGMGFTLVSNGAIMGAIDWRISPTQYKLYVLLLKYSYGKSEAYPSTITLAEKMGTSRNAIMRDTQKLQEVGYIEKSYTYPKGVKICNYRLLI